MTTLVNSFEGGASGATITTGNSGGASGSAFNGTGIGTGATLTYDSSVSAHGSLSAKVFTTATAASSYVLWTTSLGTVTTAWFRQYLYFASLPGGSIGLVTATNSSSALCSQIGLTATGHLFLDDGTGANIHSFSTAVPTGQWFRVEGFVTGDPAAGQISVQLYTVPDGTVPAESFTSAATQNTTSPVSRIAFGAYFTASNVAYWQDDVGASGSGYLGPVIVPSYLPDPLPAPPGFLSPAAFPFPNGPFGLPNDAPPVTPQPYLIAYGSNLANTASVTVGVKAPSGAGDAIVVLATNNAVPAAVTDTEGNAYAQAASVVNSIKSTMFVAQNTTGLKPGDSVTCTFQNAFSSAKNIIVIGVPLGCYTAAFPSALSGPYLTYDTTYAPTTNNRNAVSGNSGWNSLTPALGSAAVGRPELVIAAFSDEIAAGSPQFGQDWTPVASFGDNAGQAVSSINVLAYKFVTSNAQGATAVWSLYNSGPVANLLVVALYPETRLAAQAALMPGSQASPPGLMSPGAWPVFPLEVGEINEPATGTPQPYFVGAGNTTVTSSSAVIPVQNPTGRGDALTVLLPTPGTFGTPLSCTDTQGNSYSLVAYETVLQPVAIAYVAQNTNPLTAADSVTVTYAASDFRVRTGVIVGCPAGAVAASPGSTWLTYTASGTGTANGGSVIANTLSPVSGPCAVVAVISSVVANSFPLVQQGWTVLWSGSPAAGYASVVATRLTSSYRAANSAVITAQSTASGQNISAAFVILQPETRVAPNRPVPDMPPGMLAPGAWQYQPMSRAIGSLAQVITPTVLAGTGSLSAGGGRGLPGAAVLSGTGSLLGTGHKTVHGAASLSGLGTTAATGSRGLPGSALLSGSGSFTATGHKTVSAAAPLLGTGTALSDARIVRLGYAALAAPGTVTALGTRSAAGAAALSASAVLTCSYLSARIVIAANIMFPDNQSGTYGAAEAETTVIIPGVTDGTYT